MECNMECNKECNKECNMPGVWYQESPYTYTTATLLFNPSILLSILLSTLLPTLCGTSIMVLRNIMVRTRNTRIKTNTNTKTNTIYNSNLGLQFSSISHRRTITGCNKVVTVVVVILVAVVVIVVVIVVMLVVKARNYDCTPDPNANR
jgi:cytochrome bd-type quinol oxidase subunit 2